MSDERLDAVRAEIVRHQAAIKDLRHEEQSILDAACRFKVGMRVQGKRGEFEISRINHKSWGPDLFGYKIKKDGTPGARETWIWMER